MTFRAAEALDAEERNIWAARFIEKGELEEVTIGTVEQLDAFLGAAAHG